MRIKRHNIQGTSKVLESNSWRSLKVNATVHPQMLLVESITQVHYTRCIYLHLTIIIIRENAFVILCILKTDIT